MRFSTTLIALATAASANPLNTFGSERQSLVRRDDLAIPGDNPLKYCDTDHKDDIITIEKVDLTPNPPEAGTTLIIEASGTVKETIVEGAYVKLQVKYGYIRLISTQADLCKEIKNVDLDCPIEKGKISITKSVDLPKEIPPGKYTVEADVYTVDDEHVTCLTATVIFGGKKSFGSILGDL
ncbi:putative Phosphatidylglycerol/phosphatidylinositol transfer protein precursor [Triangularia verruculosa]|uniref:Phosphatidylglycerol/phosphatidylinositol transfer protein n=1 Tax=Triangularia verruculosa TaxID=2587418 RepID=A0AAN7AYA8_9PEZI|nr:putative Phosphatidylglycerol/phosphatidylinositol transfer protein precursor [Triangularia verruculosa]